MMAKSSKQSNKKPDLEVYVPRSHRNKSERNQKSSSHSAKPKNTLQNINVLKTQVDDKKSDTKNKKIQYEKSNDFREKFKNDNKNVENIKPYDKKCFTEVKVNDVESSFNDTKDFIHDQVEKKANQEEHKLTEAKNLNASDSVSQENDMKSSKAKKTASNANERISSTNNSNDDFANNVKSVKNKSFKSSKGGGKQWKFPNKQENRYEQYIPPRFLRLQQMQQKVILVNYCSIFSYRIKLM